MIVLVMQSYHIQTQNMNHRLNTRSLNNLLFVEVAKVFAQMSPFGRNASLRGVRTAEQTLQ